MTTRSINSLIDAEVRDELKESMKEYRDDTKEYHRRLAEHKIENAYDTARENVSKAMSKEAKRLQKESEKTRRDLDRIVGDGDGGNSNRGGLKKRIGKIAAGAALIGTLAFGGYQVSDNIPVNSYETRIMDNVEDVAEEMEIPELTIERILYDERGGRDYLHTGDIFTEYASGNVRMERSRYY